MSHFLLTFSLTALVCTPLLAVNPAPMPQRPMSPVISAAPSIVVAPSALTEMPTTVPASQPTDDATVSEAEDKHLERQAQVTMAMINKSLNANPPATQVSDHRGLALALLDSILHYPTAPSRPSIGAFRKLRTQHAIDDMRNTKVNDDSVVIWQIYNMGFVVRTKSVTLGFDLVELSHMPIVALDDETAKAIVDQCDVLFISHEHLDHADHRVAQMFLDAGKLVLAPDAMWKSEPIHDALTHLPRDGSAAGHSLALGAGKPSLNVSILPGMQNTRDGSVENNVYVITTPEGIRIAHTGDNNIPAGFPKKGQIAPVDVLIMKFDPGDTKVSAIIPPFSPRLVLPAHFEELGHPNVNAREPFWRGMERAAKVEFPTVLMMWGERLKYSRPT